MLLLLAQAPTTLAQAPWFAPERLGIIYGAAIGGTVALLSLLLTNRAARKRQKIELVHAAEQKEKERMHALRTEAYLPLFETLSTASAFVGQIPTLPLENVTAQEPILQLIRQIARVAVVCPKEVYEPMQRAMEQIVTTALKFTVERLSVVKLQAEIDGLDFEINLHLERQRTLIARQDALIDIGNLNNLVAQIGLQVEQFGATINERVPKKQAIQLEKAKLEMKMARQVLEHLIPNADSVCSALIAVRMDLGLKTDEVWLRQFSGQLVEKIQCVTTELLNDAERHMVSGAPHPQQNDR